MIFEEAIMSKRAYFNGSFEQRTRSFYTAAQGLPASETFSLAFNKKGVLYAGTAKGLAVLDGGKAVPVNISHQQTDCAVTMLFCDSRGYIWAGSGNSLFCIQGKKATAFPCFDTPVAAMGESEDGVLWLLTEDYLYSKKDDKSEFKKVIDVPGIGSVKVEPNTVLDPNAFTSETSGVVLLPERAVFTAENMDNYDF